jgi:hypothetical protein
MMLRGPAVALTEYEDSILFDLDDPDFGANERSSSPALLGMGLRRGSRSSCGSAGTKNFHTSLTSETTAQQYIIHNSIMLYTVLLFIL